MSRFRCLMAIVGVTVVVPALALAAGQVEVPGLGATAIPLQNYPPGPPSPVPTPTPAPTPAPTPPPTPAPMPTHT
jgi:hypothetical protein